MTAESLMYRRQFALGPKFVEVFPKWTKLAINDNLFLTIHPDLEHMHIESNGISLTLIGFLIDPYKPDNTNKENLYDIIVKADSFESFLDATYTFSGRWIIIYNNGPETKLVHDPCGMRQIFYSKKNGEVWCGSQPTLLAEILNFNVDTDTNLLNYIESPYYKNEEGAWYGDGTIYKEVKHLLPNHYFNLTSFETKRYWIDKESHTDLEDAIKIASEILTGSLAAVNTRFKNPMLAVTAGWDSRLLLAASREISSDVEYFVSTMNVLKQGHMDVKIPKKLLKKLRLKLKVLDGLNPLKSEFEDILKKNVSLARILPKTLTIQYHYENSVGKININGNASEIVRITFARARAHPKDLDGNYLANMYGYPSINYVVSALDNWLSEAKHVADNNNIEIMELFYWEQRMGNWGSMYQAEQDIAIEEFCPFNNRRFLMALLRVDKAYRVGPDYILYQKIMEKLWPETLIEPVNPLSFKDKFKSMLKTKISPSTKTKLKRLIKG